MVDAVPAIDGNGVAFRELPRPGKIILRGDPTEKGFTGAVRGALDIDLPLAANTSSQGARLSALSRDRERSGTLLTKYEAKPF